MNRFDTAKLGAGLLAASPLLINLAGTQLAWWLGVGMATAAPFLMALKPR
jgi:hypothetical protein